MRVSLEAAAKYTSTSPQIIKKVCGVLDIELIASK